LFMWTGGDVSLRVVNVACIEHRNVTVSWRLSFSCSRWCYREFIIRHQLWDEFCGQSANVPNWKVHDQFKAIGIESDTMKIVEVFELLGYSRIFFVMLQVIYWIALSIIIRTECMKTVCTGTGRKDVAAWGISRLFALHASMQTNL
jgi:hypothetical protein